MGNIGKAVCIGMIGTVALVGVGACSPTHHATQSDKCKAAATKVYDNFLKAKTLSEVIVMAAPYSNGSDDSSKLRDYLPECKPLTTKQDDRVETQLKPLYEKVTDHIDSLPMG